MEVFPTVPRTTVPRIANGLTLLTLVAVTWWSADQRPLSPASQPVVAQQGIESTEHIGESKIQARSSIATGANSAPYQGATTGGQSSAVVPVSYSTHLALPTGQGTAQARTPSPQALPR